MIAVGGPGQVFRELRGLVAAYQLTQFDQVLTIQVLQAAQGQTHAMQRQRHFLRTALKWR